MSEFIETMLCNTSNFTSTEFLHINSCTLKRNDISVRIHRPEGRLDHYFLFLLNGTIILNDSKKTVVKENQCIYYMPNDPQDYIIRTTEETPVVESYFIHFCGAVADEILKKAGITETGILSPYNPAEVKRLFESVIRANVSGDDITACGNLMRLISQLSSRRNISSNNSEKNILREAEYIITHFNQKIDFDRCAERCCISRTRFTHIFTAIIGMSPYRLQTMHRIEHARELLAYSNLSVSEVASQCGYSDPLYFSRQFSNVCGSSPSSFRKSEQSKPRTAKE